MERIHANKLVNVKCVPLFRRQKWVLFFKTTNFLDTVKRAISDTLCIAVFGTVPVNTLKFLKVRQ